jgi:hypothetical protein
MYFLSFGLVGGNRHPARESPESQGTLGVKRKTLDSHKDFY